MKQPAIVTRNLSKNYTTFHKESGLKASFVSLFIRKKYSVEALKPTNVTIEHGELVGLLGPNGAGKTTLIKLLTGVMHPTTGEAEILGFVPWKRNNTFLKQMTLVMGQKNQLWWDLPPVDTFNLHKHLYEIDEQKYKKTVDTMVEMLEVNDIITTPTRKLSLGQRMKCELIAAFLHEPKVVFLDEPTIGLDVVSQKKIRDFIVEYNKKTGATVLLTSHYMEDVKEICKRVIVINHGQTVLDTTYDDLIAKFTPTVNIELEFKDLPEKKMLEKMAPVTEYDSFTRRAVLSIPRAKKTEVTTHLLQNFEVTNVSLHEKEASEVIREVFKK